MWRDFFPFLWPTGSSWVSVQGTYVRLCSLKPCIPDRTSVHTRAVKGWALKRALRSSSDVWCGEGLARALFPRFRCARRAGEIFLFCKPEILFSFCNFNRPGSHKRETVNSARVRKKVIFTLNRQKCRLILTVKKFQGISNLSISADLPELLAPKEFRNLKSHAAPTFSKTLPLEITRPYNLLISKNISNFYVIMRAKATSKTQQLI